jgi:endonuclease/exonuclease/phosphatase family metal-dependent hydrolase
MSLTITTWNVQNFSRNDAVYADKLNYIATTIKALRSDVVALQEILDQGALKDLANQLGFSYFAATPDGRGIGVALLARYAPPQPATEIAHWQLAPGIEVRDFDNNGAIKVLPQFPRPAFKITIPHNGSEIEIITAHLKSKLLSFRGHFSTTDETLRARTAYFALERRAAEATTLREQVTALLKNPRNVVLLGDFNDGSEAATTEILYGPPGSQPRGPEDATHATGAFQRGDAEDKQRLFNVTKLVPEERRWSRRYNGTKELIDHILVSQGLMPRANGLRQVPTMSILNDDTPNLIGANPTVNGVIPDHAPVTAQFV